MHQKRTRSSRPKLFQCTGFGDCNMVFTRSEHLARHSRKHTGEKPFVCIVPLCAKAFSRFDNMMQHTQTHRNNHFNIVTPPNMNNKSKCNNSKKDSISRDTRSSTRVAAQQTQPPITHTNRNNELHITTTQQHNTTTGLVSPVSLSSFSPKRYHARQCSSSSSDEDEEEDDNSSIISSFQPITRRRLSVADLCNPSNEDSHKNIHLTKDELEALEGFGRFRHSPSVFFDSLKDLASNAHIEPY